MRVHLQIESTQRNFRTCSNHRLGPVAFRFAGLKPAATGEKPGYPRVPRLKTERLSPEGGQLFARSSPIDWCFSQMSTEPNTVGRK